jgi:hypothetical protein
MSKELENSPKIGRPLGSVNTRNLEIFELAQELKFSPIKVKILLATLNLKELGFTEEDIKYLNVNERIEIIERNTADLLPYFYGKRKPVDSNGDDSSDPITDILNAIKNN